MRRISALFACSFAFALITACSEGVKPPVAQVAAPPAAVNAGSYVLLDGSASLDPQGRPLTYAWSFLDRPLGSSAALVDEHTATPSFLADMPGTYVLQLIVSNSVLISPPSLVTVQVSTCAANPPAIASPLLASKNPLNIGETTQLTATVTDADNEPPCSLKQTLSYEWVIIQQPAGSTATLNSERSETPSLVPDKSGDYLVRLTVTDSTGRSSQPQSILVTVANCGGNAPLVAPTAIPGTTHPNAAVQLDAHGSDPDDACVAQTLTYQWSVRAKPEGATAVFSSSVSVRPTLRGDKGGAYELGVVATDQTGRSSQVGVITVNVEPCGEVGPTVAGIAVVSGASGTPATGTVGTSVSVQAVDVSSLNCLATGAVATEWSLTAPSGSIAALNDATAPSPSFTPDRPGEYRLAVQVRDSLGNKSAPAFLQITAAPCTPAAIEWGAQPITTVATDPQAGAPSFTDGNGNPMPHVGALVQVTPHATVPSYCGSIPTGPLSWSWTLSSRASESEAALDSSKTQSPSFRVDKNGHYGVSVVATDALGNRSAPRTLELDTTGCGVNPVTTLLLTGAGSPLVSSPQAPVSVGSFAPFTIAAGIATDDNLTAVCPARFHVSADFSYRLAIQPAYGSGTLSNVFGDSTVFEARAAGAYAVDVDGAVTNLAGRVHASPAFVYLSAASCSPPVVSVPIFSVAGSGSPGVFKGDVVTVGVAVVPGNCGAISQQLTYSWTLSRPPGSTATLSSATSATPSFVPDVAGGSFAVSVAVTDGQGNTSISETLTITTSACGNSPIFAAIADAPGARPFDDHTFSAVPASGRTTFSDDDAACPARFAGQYSFSWSVVSSAPSAGYTLDTTTGSAVHFTPGGNAVYSVKLVVQGPTQRAEVTRQVAVSCSDVVPRPGTLFIASSTAGYAPGRFFFGDNATLSATPTSLCYSDGSTGYSYLWTLQAPPGSASTLSSTTSAHPTFAVDIIEGTWEATVIVVDKLGNRSNTGTARFKSEKCGLNPVTARFIDTRVGVSPFAAFDPHDLQATGFSVDDDPAVCPARFKNPSYSFSDLMLTAPLSAVRWTFVPSSASAGRFEAGENSVFLVSVEATGTKSGLSGPGSLIIDVRCADTTPAVTQPVITSVSDPDNITVPGEIFRDETVTVATTASAACYTSTNLRPQYQWSFGSGTTDALADFSDKTAATPSFFVNESGATYKVQVQVRDQWGNGPGSNSGTFVAETCGRNPVLLTAAGVQATGATLPFDPWTVTASASSADDDPNQCPQPRFPQTYTFTWAVSAFPAAASKFALSTTAGPQTVFSEGEPDSGVYGITATATGSKSGLQGHGTASITTAPCVTPGPTFLGDISISDVTPPAPDPYYGGNFGKFFANDRVGLVTAPAAFTCYSNQTLAAPAYVWSLTTTVPPTPAIVRAAVGIPPTASFTADQANRTYRARVDAQDHWGNGGLHTHDFISGGCGVSPITAAILTTQAMDAKPMDDWMLTGVAAIGAFFSADSDPAQCPGRFAPTYQFVWSLNPDSGGVPPGTFSSTSTNPTTFTPGTHRSYSVHLMVSGNGQSGTADQALDANCNPPLVETPVVAAVNGGSPPPPTIFAGDLVMVATTATSQCLAHPLPSSFSYMYTLLRDGAPAPEPFTPSANDAQPSFQPQKFGATYQVSVTVSDASVQSGSPAAPLQIDVSTCGSVEPQVFASVSTQEFDAILQRIESASESSLPLAITQTAPSLTPVVQVPSGGAPHSVEVPFYLNTPIGVDMTITIPAFCPNVRFTSAQLQDPHFELIPADQWNQPGPTTVTAGQTLHFSFVPRVGDEKDSTGTIHPGLYSLLVNLAFGRTNEPIVTFVRPEPINVGGRCGTNVPFADAILTASSVQVGTLIGIDATTSSDADNDTLTFLLVSDTSTGCGFQQQLTYAWLVRTPPSGSTAQVVPAPGLAQFNFTPDVPGGYDLELQVTDDTALAEGPKTGTKTFHVSAGEALAFTAAPASGNTNIPLGAVTVAFTTASGAPCPTCTGTVTLSAGGGPAMLGDPLHLSGTGSVTFAGVTFSAAGDYTLTATSDIGGTAISGPIHIEDSQLVVTVSSTVPGAPIVATRPFNVLVEAHDGLGVRVPLAASVHLGVCLSGPPCGPGPEGAMMSGSITFTTTIDTPGTYTIRASATGATSGTSVSFGVVP